MKCRIGLAACLAMACALSAVGEKAAYDPSVSVYPKAKTYKRAKAWGLTALLARQAKLSDAQKDAKGVYQTERTIFAGPVLGGEVWKLTHDNLHDHHWYQDMSPWNANGSRIMFRSDRAAAAPPDLTRALLMNADGTGARKYTTKLPLDSRRPAWSRVDPDVHYSLRKGVLYEHNVRTGTTGTCPTSAVPPSSRTSGSTRITARPP